MLKPKACMEEFERFGFKKCKGDYGKNGVYYLCVSRGCKILIVTPEIFDIQDWLDDDPRIHKNANCKRKDTRDAIEILFDLIRANMLDKESSQRYAFVDYDPPEPKFKGGQKVWVKKRRATVFIVSAKFTIFGWIYKCRNSFDSNYPFNDYIITLDETELEAQHE